MPDQRKLAAMREHYDRGEELGRLGDSRGRLEFERTKEIVLRHLPPPPAVVADIGGGPGSAPTCLPPPTCLERRKDDSIHGCRPTGTDVPHTSPESGIAVKPTKNSVAVVIRNGNGEILVVRRPEDEDGPLAGVWGLPAVTLRDGESEQDAVRRAGRVKLGVELRPGGKIGAGTSDRGGHVLHLSDYRAEIVRGTPSVPQPDTSMTQYADLTYTGDPGVLYPAARRGSLCSQVYLRSIGTSWDS